MNNAHYHPVVKLLHWVTVAALVGTSILGFFFSDMPRGEEKTELLKLHASFGLLILGVVLCRIGARLLTTKPAPVMQGAKWQNRAAAALHGLLYTAMIALILAGMFALFSVGWGVSFFGLFEIPTPLIRDIKLHHLFETIHVAVWWCLLVMVVGHLAAALHHHFIKRNALLARMWWRN